MTSVSQFVRVVQLELNGENELHLDRKTKFAVRIIQFFLQEIIKSFGYERKTFSLESISASSENLHLEIKDVEKNFVTHVCKYSIDLETVETELVWKDVAKKLVQSNHFDRKTECKWLVIGHSRRPKATSDALEEPLLAEGGGGLALFIQNNITRWPESIGDLVSVLKGEGSISKAQYSHSLGAMLHELCHTFDLGHAPKGIMNRDFAHFLDVFEFLLLKNEAENLSTQDCLIPPKVFGSTIFTKEGLTVLNRHLWLNHTFLSLESEVVLQGTRIDFSSPRSAARLMFIQFWVEGFVAKHIDLDVGCNSFALGRDHLCGIETNGGEKILVLVMDDVGNVFKRFIDLYELYMSK